MHLGIKCIVFALAIVMGSTMYGHTRMTGRTDVATGDYQCKQMINEKWHCWRVKK